MYVLNHPWVDFDEIRKRTDLVIVPTGAVEVYGEHLPTGSDTIVISHVASQVGEQLEAPVLPTLPVGFSRSLGDFPGTLNVSPATIRAYLIESVESAIQWGFRRVLFLNSHRGNIGPVSEVAMELQDRHGVVCAQVFWWDYAAGLAGDITESGAHANGHAAEVGTSVLMHLEPKLVIQDRIRDHTPIDGPAYPDIIQFKGMRARSETGCVGNPTVATSEKGAEIVTRGVERIVAFVRDEFHSPES